MILNISEYSVNNTEVILMVKELKKIMIVLITISCVCMFLSCGESFESQLNKVEQSSGTPFAIDTATAIIYSKYKKEMPVNFKGTIYKDVYDLLGECNFWSKGNYDKLYSAINESDSSPIAKEIVTAVLNLKFKKEADYAPIVQDVVDVLIESGIFTSPSKQEEKKDKKQEKKEIVLLINDEYDHVFYCPKEKNVLSLLQELGLEDEWNTLGTEKHEKVEEEEEIYDDFELYIIPSDDYEIPHYNDGYYLSIHTKNSGEDKLEYIGYCVFTKQPERKFKNGRWDVEDDYLNIKKSWAYW